MLTHPLARGRLAPADGCYSAPPVRRITRSAFTGRMRRLWRSINRDLWPRRYTAGFTGIFVGGFAIFQTMQLFASRIPVRASQWFWLAFFWWVAVSSLVEATTGVFSNLLRRRYAKRREAGLCGKCGYDLRATPSVNCPECGTWHGTTPAKRFARAAGESHPHAAMDRPRVERSGKANGRRGAGH